MSNVKLCTYLEGKCNKKRKSGIKHVWLKSSFVWDEKRHTFAIKMKHENFSIIIIQGYASCTCGIYWRESRILFLLAATPTGLIWPFSFPSKSSFPMKTWNVTTTLLFSHFLPIVCLLFAVQHLYNNIMFPEVWSFCFLPWWWLLTVFCVTVWL